MRRIARQLAAEEAGERPGLVPFERALNDDFDSPRAVDWAEETLRRAASVKDRSEARGLAASAVTGMRILGVDLLGTS